MAIQSVAAIIEQISQITSSVASAVEQQSATTPEIRPERRSGIRRRLRPHGEHQHRGRAAGEAHYAAAHLTEVTAAPHPVAVAADRSRFRTQTPAARPGGQKLRKPLKGPEDFLCVGRIPFCRVWVRSGLPVVPKTQDCTWFVL
jgi:hypothetical protein